LPSIIAVVLGTVGGLFAGYKFNKYAKAIGTAVIGSFLLIRGIGCYAGGFPSDYSGVEDTEYSTAVLGYLAGMVFSAVAGVWFQLRFFKTEHDKFNEMDNEDEAKVCGCL
jgi:hypothetical protein